MCDLVHTMRFWNNFLQVSSQPKEWKYDDNNNNNNNNNNNKNNNNNNNNNNNDNKNKKNNNNKQWVTLIDTAFCDVIPVVRQHFPTLSILFFHGSQNNPLFRKVGSITKY
jgi:hypothetical protein